MHLKNSQYVLFYPLFMNLKKSCEKKLLLQFTLEQGVHECSMNMVGYKAQLVFAGKDGDKARYALCFIIITY